MIFVQLFIHPDFQAKNFTPINSVIWDIFHSRLMPENMLFSGEVYTTDTAGSDGRDKSHL